MRDDGGRYVLKWLRKTVDFEFEDVSSDGFTSISKGSSNRANGSNGCLDD
jgi:hypothetical protein